MDSGLAVAAAGVAFARAAGDAAPPLTWERVAERTTLYLHALGIRDPLQCERLIARIRQRWDARVHATPLEDPVEAAIEETCSLLDGWLCTELGIDGERAALFTARAAVLSGAVPNWSARFAGVSGDSIATQIHAASVHPLPEPAPLTMEPSVIHLCCYRLRHRVAAAFGVLIGSHPIAAPGTTAVADSAADSIKAGPPR
jgi:hypothetical protein